MSKRRAPDSAGMPSSGAVPARYMPAAQPREWDAHPTSPNACARTRGSLPPAGEQEMKGPRPRRPFFAFRNNSR